MDYSAPNKAFLLVQLLLLFTCLSLPIAFSQARRSRLRSLPPAHSPIEDHHGRHPAPLHPPVHPPISHRHHHDGHGHPPSDGRHPAPVHPPIHPPSHHHDHGHAPSHASVHPPAPSPAPPPPPDVDPWLELPLGAVEGVVFCKSCAYAGVNTIYGAKPISGAVVKLVCNDTQDERTVATGETDKDGLFYIEVRGIDVSGEVFPTCKVYLVSSPLPTCSLPSNLNGGITGGTMKWVTPPIYNMDEFVYYRVGPFAVEPACEL